MKNKYTQSDTINDNKTLVAWILILELWFLNQYADLSWYKCDSKILVTSDFYAIIKGHLYCLRFSLSNVQND